MNNDRDNSDVAIPSLLGVKWQYYYVDMELPPNYVRTRYYVYAVDEAAANKAFEALVRDCACS